MKQWMSIVVCMLMYPLLVASVMTHQHPQLVVDIVVGKNASIPPKLGADQVMNLDGGASSGKSIF